MPEAASRGDHIAMRMVMSISSTPIKLNSWLYPPHR